MKLFVFILIYSIGIVLSSTCNVKVFHFGIWYSIVFGGVWYVLLKVEYSYTKQKISLPDMMIRWFEGETPTKYFIGVDPYKETKIKKKSFIKSLNK
jgi:hypothetical protein